MNWFCHQCLLTFPGPPVTVQFGLPASGFDSRLCAVLLSIPVIDAAGQGPQRPTHAAVYPTAGTDGGYHQFGTKLALSVAPASPTPTRDGGGAASLGAGQLGARSICLCPLPPAANNGWQRAAGLLNVRCACLAPGSNDDNMWLWGSGPVGPLCALCACLAYASNTNDGWRLSAEQLGQPRYTLRLLFLRLCQWWWVMVGHDL